MGGAMGDGAYGSVEEKEGGGESSTGWRGKERVAGLELHQPQQQQPSVVVVV